MSHGIDDLPLTPLPRPPQHDRRGGPELLKLRDVHQPTPRLQPISDLHSHAVDGGISEDNATADILVAVFPLQLP
eukprot:7853220-Pyramimonas_sp.AAC.1